MNHDVHFLHLKRELGDDKLMQEFWGDKFYSVPYKDPGTNLSLTRKVGERLKCIFEEERAFTYAIDDWYDDSIDKFFVQLSRRIAFNVVMVEYVFFSKALECFGKNALKIIDTHDVFTNRHRLFLQSGQRPKWYSTTANEEAKGLNRADVIIAIEQNEKEFFSKLTDKKVIMVGHTVPLFKPVRNASDDKNILFVGSANKFNVEGIHYFIENIFPKIRTDFSGAKLVLAGRVCNAVEDFSGCIKLGELDDITVAYNMADLVINPVRFGTGLNIKSIEALGYSRPLVTTRIGSKGLEGGANEAFLAADTPEDFALAIVKIFSDSEFCSRLSKNAYDFAKRWNAENLKALGNVLA